VVHYIHVHIRYINHTTGLETGQMKGVKIPSSHYHN